MSTSLENEYQIQLNDEQQQYLDDIRQLLPSFIDINSDSDNYLEDQIKEVGNYLNQKQQKHLVLNETVFKIIKERDHQFPTDNLKPMFNKIYQQFFEGYVYQQPSFSVFFENSEFPDIRIVKKFLADLEKQEHEQQQQQEEEKISSTKLINQYQNNEEQDIVNQLPSSDLPLDKQTSMEVQSKNEVYDKIGEQIQKYQSNNFYQKTSIQILLCKIFNFFDGRIPKIFNSFLFFPKHLYHYFECFEEFYINNGPIPLQQIYYITIMTAAAQGNIYVYNLFMERFKRLGGDEAWIDQGYEALPLKLQKVWELIWASIVHPTNISKKAPEMYAYLIEGETEECWGYEEVVFIIMLINFTINLANVAQGFGLSTQDQLEFKGRFNCIQENIFKPTYSQQLSNFSDNAQSQLSQQSENSELTNLCQLQDNNNNNLINNNHQLQSEGNIIINNKSEQCNSFQFSSFTTNNTSIVNLNQQPIPQNKQKICKTSSCNNEVISTKSSDENTQEYLKSNQFMASISQNASPHINQPGNPRIQNQLLLDSESNSQQNSHTFIKNSNNNTEESDNSNELKQQTTKQIIQKIKSQPVTQQEYTHKEVLNTQQQLIQENLKEYSSEDEQDGTEYEGVKKSFLSKYVQSSKFFNGCKSNRKAKDFVLEQDQFLGNKIEGYVNNSSYQSLFYKFQNKIDYAKIMTNNDLGKQKSIDTQKFRQCLWDYIETLQGYKNNQDLDYKLVSNIFSQKFRKYIRKLTNDPWNLEKQDVQNINIPFLLKDYIHISILVGECKFQTRVMFLLNSFGKYKMNALM